MGAIGVRRPSRIRSCQPIVKAMIHTFIVTTEHGQRIYTGHVSSRSPSTIAMLLTTPYDQAGRVVRIQTDDVISEHQAA